MTKFLLTSVLAVSFLIPGVSFGADNVFGVNVPVERHAVNSNVTAGSYIAKDNSLVNTLVPQKPGNERTEVSGEREDEDTFYVFGVNIKAKNLI